MSDITRMLCLLPEGSLLEYPVPESGRLTAAQIAALTVDEFAAHRDVRRSGIARHYRAYLSPHEVTAFRAALRELPLSPGGALVRWDLCGVHATHRVVGVVHAGDTRIEVCQVEPGCVSEAVAIVRAVRSLPSQPAPKKDSTRKTR